MNQIALRFMKEYENGELQGARYARQYDLQRLYDSNNDEFFIEEINDAYEEFKQGGAQ